MLYLPGFLKIIRRSLKLLVKHVAYYALFTTSNYIPIVIYYSKMSSIEGKGDTGSDSTSIEVNGTEAFDWKIEQDKLINKVNNFEKQLGQTALKLTTLENDLKIRTQERDDLKKQITELHEQIGEAKKQNQKNAVDSNAVDVIKRKSEEMLTRAKDVIFEKTKIVKNQELQIEALTQQISSLKEVVRITKDLLEIRNVEVKHLQEKIDGMEAKIHSEKDKHNLIQSKLEKMVQLNCELKREYETQLCLFSALRERYNERELARNVLTDLRNENNDTASTSGNVPDSSSN